MSSIPAQSSHSESNNQLDAAAQIDNVEQRIQPRAGGRLGRSLIALAGLLGVVAILVTIAPFFGWTVVRLATGSMAPIFPTDSLLITHTVPASQVVIGEIVTVQRLGLLPITHRVVSAKAVASGLTQLTLKGDDNATPDAYPYLVRTVGLVEAGVPWGGGVFASLHSTVGLAGLTVFVTLLVLWAWWPTSASRQHDTSDHRHAEGA